MIRHASQFAWTASLKPQCERTHCSFMGKYQYWLLAAAPSRVSAKQRWHAFVLPSFYLKSTTSIHWFTHIHTWSSPVGLWSSLTHANEGLSAPPVVHKETAMTVVGRKEDRYSSIAQTRFSSDSHRPKTDTCITCNRRKHNVNKIALLIM